MSKHIDSKALLHRLGHGDSIEAVAASAGLSRAELYEWWQAEIAERVPGQSGMREAPVAEPVEIERNEWGIPSIYAERDTDLFVGFGYAMAQDRLFQLDYLRRKAMGRLSEVLGEDGLELDTIARTIGLNRIAAAQWRQTSASTRILVEAFTSGVNAFLEESKRSLPIEFDLLDYQPEPWTPVDCTAIAVEFRSYLTVRLPVIVVPELAKRRLGDGALYRAFLQGEADEESILHAGEHPSQRAGADPVSAAVSSAFEGHGSNNWVLGGAKTTSGRPIVASDPHIAFAAVSCWYEVHLCGGSFDVAGMAYVGMPAVMFGRNTRLAWGITNNACSQRDLYQEKTDPEHPGAYLYDGEWEPAREIVEEIAVRGAPARRTTVRYSRNGPIVDELLPPAAGHTGPVSLRWLGAEPCGWLTTLLDMNRAGDAAQFREALRDWRVPTFSLVFADTEGHIGYQAAGTIPIRDTPERGYRPGWDPDQQWQGTIPLDGMPRLGDPDRGWIATANNRPAPDDFPYPLSGVWDSGHRAQRIRQLIESKDKLSADDVASMQQDAKSLRAETCAPRLVSALEAVEDERIRSVLARLRSWDHVMEPDSVAASIFEVFFSHWMSRVARERFRGGEAELLGRASAGLASALLARDEAGWFADGARAGAIIEAVNAALHEIESRLGPEMNDWTWGSLHKVELRHVLSGRGDLGELLDRGGLPVRGNGVTVCNTGFDPNWGAELGANYRLICDLGASPPALCAIDAQGTSGHPGSAHYCDQLAEWIEGRYHRLPLDRVQAKESARTHLRLEPG